MKELQYGDGAFYVDDHVAEALETLADALTESGMSATIRLRPSNDGSAIEFTLGPDRTSGKPPVLRARPATGEGSRLGLEDM